MDRPSERILVQWEALLVSGFEEVCVMMRVEDTYLEWDCEEHGAHILR